MLNNLLHFLVTFRGKIADVLIEETDDETEYCELVDTILTIGFSFKLDAVVNSSFCVIGLNVVIVSLSASFVAVVSVVDDFVECFIVVDELNSVDGDFKISIND